MTDIIPIRSNSNYLLGDLPAYRKNPVEFWLGLGKISPIVKIRFGTARRFIVNDPDIARHILQLNYKNYTKDQRLKKILEGGTGPIMTTSDGEDWRWRRKLMQPSFKHGAIAHFATNMVNQTKLLISGWKNGDVIDIAEAMKTVTMNIIGQTMFSVDFTQDSRGLHHAYTKFGDGLIRRATSVIQVPLSLPTKNNLEFRDSIATMKGVLADILTERRQKISNHNDLLNMLLTYGLEDDDRRFTEDQLLHEMSAIVFAGHETTATTLTWVFALLAQHPEIYQKLIREIDQSLQGRNPSVGNLKAMPYLEQVLEEVLRLYPPLYIISRQAIRSDKPGNYALEPGSRMLINILGIHRNENHWPNPHIFDPSRFTQEKKRDQHSFAQIPFSKGPRICIGSTFAMLELKIIIPMILQKFSLSLVQGNSVEPEARAVLQPKGGLPMKLVFRR